MRNFLVVVFCMFYVWPQGLGAEPSKENEKEAAKAFALGSRLFEEQKYAGAIEAFQRAYDLKPHFLVQCNIARCHEFSKDMVKAW
ncbi:MAG: hypothetical protein V1754_08950, partial [Pseudomonadota bacterium]